MQLANGIVTPVPYTGNILASIHQTISELLEDIRSILDALPKVPPFDQVVNLSSTPIQLSGNGYRYHLLFLFQPATLTVDIPVLGQSTLELEIGWYDFTFPLDTQIALTNGSLSALYRCTDTLEGGIV